MRDILSKVELRQLELIEYLYENNTSTLNDLSLISGSSRKTIRHDIQELNGKISPSQIIISKDSGTFLQLDTHTSIEYIYSQFLFSSTEFLIIEYIFFQKYKTLDDLADALFISLSTLRRLINRINQSLRPCNFKIDSQKIDLIGDEKLIYNFIVRYFEEKYRNTTSIFSEIQLNTIDQLIIYAAKEDDLDTNYPYMEKLRLWIMVILIRITNGHSYIPSQEQLDLVKTNFITNQSINQSFKATFKIDLTNIVFFQLFYCFFDKNYCRNLEELTLLAKKNDEVNIFIHSLTSFLEDIAETLSIEIENKEELVLNLFNLTPLNSGKPFILNDKYRTFITSITHDYSHFYDFITDTVSRNLLNVGIDWDEDAINTFSYMLITNWNGLVQQIENNIKVFSVGLFFETDMGHVNMLREQLTYYFKNRLTFTIIDKLTLSEFKNETKNYDIILTNLFSLDISNSIVIVLSRTLTPSDLKNIDNTYLKLLHQSKKLDIH